MASGSRYPVERLQNIYGTNCYLISLYVFPIPYIHGISPA